MALRLHDGPSGVDTTAPRPAPDPAAGAPTGTPRRPSVRAVVRPASDPTPRTSRTPAPAVRAAAPRRAAARLAMGATARPGPNVGRPGGARPTRHPAARARGSAGPAPVPARPGPAPAAHPYRRADPADHRRLRSPTGPTRLDARPPGAPPPAPPRAPRPAFRRPAASEPRPSGPGPPDGRRDERSQAGPALGRRRLGRARRAVVGAAWAAAGHHVVAASGVSRESVKRAAALLPDVPLRPPDEVVRRGRPGAAGRARRRAARPGPRAGRGGQLPRRADRGAHLRRARGVVLAPATEHGVLPLALHPVMTFTGRVEDVARLGGAASGSPRPPATRPAGAWARRWCVEMGAEPVRIAEEVRPLYHAALAHGANHLITLVRDCVQTLERAGMQPGRPAGRAAAVGGAGQRAAARRSGAHRSGRARRRARPCAPTCGCSPRTIRTWPRPTGCWPRAPPAAPPPAGCSPSRRPPRC